MEDLAHHSSIRKMTDVQKPSAIPDHRGSLLSPGRRLVHGGHEWCPAHQHIGSAPRLTPCIPYIHDSSAGASEQEETFDGVNT